MSAGSRAGYETLLQALGICISCRIPFLLWGAPGEGKTAVVESTREHGWHVETIIVSHHEPSDFAGLPVRQVIVILTPRSVVVRRLPAGARVERMCSPRTSV